MRRQTRQVIEALTTGVPSERMWAASALAAKKHKTSAVADALCHSAIYDPHQLVRTEALLALITMNLQFTVPTVIKALKDTCYLVRKAAARALAAMAEPGDVEVINALIERSQDRDERVRHEIYRAINHLRAESRRTSTDGECDDEDDFLLEDW